MDAKKTILLTGAGFTHNFGAPLAEGLWALLLNRPDTQSCDSVRQALLRNLDFEAVYNEIMEGPSTSPCEKKAINDALRSVYDEIDRTVSDFNFNVGAPYPINIYNVQKMINAFNGTHNEPGFLFTLNQDLFFERQYYNGEKPFMPGIQQDPNWFSSTFTAPLQNQDYRQLPTAIERLRTGHGLGSHVSLYFLKLHGSCNWVSGVRQTQMVIGRGKKAQIIKEPLLAWYFDIFNEVLSQPGGRLLSIGYGFGDDHINEVIANAIMNNGMKLYVICPMSAGAFRQGLIPKHRGSDIWSGLGGYLPYTFQQIFPADQSISAAWQSLQDQYFGRRIV